jgi:hypothetical protein
MRVLRAAVLGAVGFMLVGAVTAVALENRSELDPLVAKATGSDAAASRAAIEALRTQGPHGLEALFAVAGSAHDPRFATVIDAVAAQKDASFSRLFWYTDLELAKKAAREQGKPILSLRLLGNLDSELSCANSRFFRTALYANDEVSKLLRDKFVLHWQSVRPVPRITIDFGDGRKIERTITGNSIHYVLNPDGQVIDALPGMYGPGAFKRILDESYDLARHAQLDPTAARAHQAVARAVILNRLSVDVARTGVNLGAAAAGNDARPAARAGGAPRADAAALRAMSKVAVQAPMVRALVPRSRDMGKAMTDDGWNAVAALHAQDCRLDAASIALIRHKRPGARTDSIDRMIASFERSMAQDTIRNESLLRTQILQWLASGEGKDLNALNDRVYAELFLTPTSDPWLGLAPRDAYSGLENDGLVTPTR